MSRIALPDTWGALRARTPARIALGRSGAGLPTDELLRFGAAHAAARDAVQQPLDVPRLLQDLQALGFTARTVHSRAATRAEYLRRPDLGRRLRPQDRKALAGAPVPLAVVLGDGLSAAAVQAHAVPTLAALREALGEDGEGLAVVVARQARVALADEVGEALQARAVVILLGERPGLSSPDSLGAYLTYAPKVGRTDAERNCVSNIRPEGLPPAEAARRIAWLLREAMRLQRSGVALKDGSDTPVLDRAPPG